ncbi:hypothetical protein MHIMP23_07035 [Methylobacterium hispanicum]
MCRPRAAASRAESASPRHTAARAPDRPKRTQAPPVAAAISAHRWRTVGPIAKKSVDAASMFAALSPRPVTRRTRGAAAGLARL